jgi:hypothetical protein
MSAPGWEEDFAADEPRTWEPEAEPANCEPRPWELPGGRGFTWEVSYDDGRSWQR